MLHSARLFGVITKSIGGGTGGGGGGGGGGTSPPPLQNPSLMTSQVSQTLPLFMIDTPSYSQKLPGIATRIDHCARFPPFHPASSP